MPYEGGFVCDWFRFLYGSSRYFPCTLPFFLTLSPAWYLLICNLGNVNNNPEEIKDGQVNVESRDNRSLIDNNTAQSLTGEDIEAMRRWGYILLVGFWLLMLSLGTQWNGMIKIYVYLIWIFWFYYFVIMHDDTNAFFVPLFVHMNSAIHILLFWNKLSSYYFFAMLGVQLWKVILYILCRQGAKGNEIIDALIANSATFEKKTAFSQVYLSVKRLHSLL